MLVLILAATLAMPQDGAVLDVPVYSSAEWGVSLRRPFDDWVFSPATSRGTTTVIFQPRHGSLSDQLWGALVLSPWGRMVPIREVADRRITTTWRSTLGPQFRLLARDSVDVAGVPAIHLVMTGAINNAVLDVEEYLIARDSDLIALQFRYPRGQPRDSIGSGYLRSLASLAVRAPSRAARQPRAGPVWQVAIDRGLLFFDLPQEYQAVAPGWLSSELVAGGRRTMRWTPLIGAPDTTLYAVGRFRLEPRRIGRLTVRVWRNLSQDSSLARVTDEMLATLAQAWGVYWRHFGPVPTTEISVVETAWQETRGGAAVVFVGANARDSMGTFVLRRELARTWWGGVVRSDSSNTRLIDGALPLYSAIHVGPPPARLNDVLMRASVGSPERFRVAIRTLLLESRGGPAAIDRFLHALGDSAAATIRPLLR